MTGGQSTVVLESSRADHRLTTRPSVPRNGSPFAGVEGGLTQIFFREASNRVVEVFLGRQGRLTRQRPWRAEYRVSHEGRSDPEPQVLAHPGVPAYLPQARASFLYPACAEYVDARSVTAVAAAKRLDPPKRVDIREVSTLSSALLGKRPDPGS